ncbi:hypothetical protein [Amycolatopsis sp. MtRt-6]|nr:hypothetical protein [Amycolatopsis sp. MtRt-6]
MTHLLTVLPFLLSVIVVSTSGADAQAAAEAELTRQGLPGRRHPAVRCTW